MYDFVTMLLMFSIFASIYCLGCGINESSKKDIRKAVIAILAIFIISIAAFCIDISCSPQQLVAKVELMYKRHPRTYLKAPVLARDKVRELNGWIIDYLAIEYLEKALEQDPYYNAAKIKLCEMYVYKHEYDMTIKYANTVGSESKEDPKLLEWEAIAYFRLGDKAKAYEKYKLLEEMNAVSSHLDIIFTLDSLPEIPGIPKSQI